MLLVASVGIPQHVFFWERRLGAEYSKIEKNEGASKQFNARTFDVERWRWNTSALKLSLFEISKYRGKLIRLYFVSIFFY